MWAWRRVVLATGLAIACGPTVELGGDGTTQGTGAASGAAESGPSSTGAGPTTTSASSATSLEGDGTSESECEEIHEGSLEITAATELASFACLVEVTGMLHIHDTVLVDLSALGNLRRVGADLLIENNPELASLTGLAGLEHVHGVMSIRGNAQITSLTGLGAALELGGLAVEDNPGLISLLGVPSQLAFVAYSVAEHHHVSFSGNPSLYDLDGLLFVESVEAELPMSLYVQGNGVVSSVYGLRVFSPIAERLSLWVTDEPNLSTLTDDEGASDGLGLTVIDMLVLHDLPALEALWGLWGLTDARIISIAGLPACSSFESLGETLQRVTQRLAIGSCDIGSGVGLLSGLYLPEVVEVGELVVYRNDNMNAIYMDALQHVAGDLRIVENPALPSATVESWALGLEVDGETIICGNSDGVACERPCP